MPKRRNDDAAVETTVRVPAHTHLVAQTDALHIATDTAAATSGHAQCSVVFHPAERAHLLRDAARRLVEVRTRRALILAEWRRDGAPQASELSSSYDGFVLPDAQTILLREPAELVVVVDDDKRSGITQASVRDMFIRASLRDKASDSPEGVS